MSSPPASSPSALIQQWRESAAILRRAANPLSMTEIEAARAIEGAATLEFCADRLEAALARPEGEDWQAKWQDISTAPRDGTHVLLWCVDEHDDGIEAVGVWFDGWANPMTSEQLRDEATLWRPLPSPPDGPTTDRSDV